MSKSTTSKHSEADLVMDKHKKTLNFQSLKTIIQQFEPQGFADTEYKELQDKITRYQRKYPKEFETHVKKLLSLSNNIDLEKDTLIKNEPRLCKNLKKVIQEANQHNHQEDAALATKDLRQLLALNEGYNDLEKKSNTQGFQAQNTVPPQRSCESAVCQADHQRVYELAKTVEDQKREINELYSRLSKFAREQIMAGNPNITNLSDKNRPMKVAERFGEIYSNAWTDAYEILKHNFKYDGKKVKKELNLILMNAFYFTRDLAEKHLRSITHQLFEAGKHIPSTENLKSVTDVDQGKSNNIKQLAEKHSRPFWKEIGPLVFDEVFKNFQEEFVRTRMSSFYNTKHDELAKYMFQCCEVTWLMALQDSPMDLLFPEPRSRFDTNFFHFYQNQGDLIDFVVWPALLLHEKGPILRKGYAEPIMESEIAAKQKRSNSLETSF